MPVQATRPALESAPTPPASGPVDARRHPRGSVFYPKADSPLDDAALRDLRRGDCSAIAPSDVLDACRSALGRRPISVTPLPFQGTFHRLYRAVMPDGLPVIVRTSPIDAPGHDHGLLADLWASRRLRPLGLPVVEVFAVDLSRAFVPFDFQVMAEAPGRSLREFDHDDDAILPLLHALGRTIARLHGVRLEGFGWVDASPMTDPGADPGRIIGIFDSWGDYVRLRLCEHLSICVSLGSIDAAEADRIGRLFGDSGGLFRAVEPRLLHGDLGNHNVFVSGGQVSALIDWEDCLAGDPAFDVAFWATFHPDRRLDAILGGYGSEAESPGDFLRRFWLYYLRIALSKTVLRHRFGDVDRPGRAPAAARIRKALDRLHALDERPGQPGGEPTCVSS
jgi:hypothetical protein